MAPSKVSGGHCALDNWLITYFNTKRASNSFTHYTDNESPRHHDHSCPGALDTSNTRWGHSQMLTLLATAGAYNTARRRFDCFCDFGARQIIRLSHSLIKSVPQSNVFVAYISISAYTWQSYSSWTRFCAVLRFQEILVFLKIIYHVCVCYWVTAKFHYSDLVCNQILSRKVADLVRDFFLLQSGRRLGRRPGRRNGIWA